MEGLPRLIFGMSTTVVFVSGTGEGSTELMAFDKALQEAGIADVNLVKVSSIIPAKAKIVNWDPCKTKLPKGAFIPVLLSKVTSSIPGERIIASLAAYKTSNTLGVSIEYHAKDISRKNMKETCEKMVADMIRRRGMEIAEPIIFKCAEHVVKNHGCALAALLYL